ncbi:MAG: hypothetical protein KGZ59_12695, partial [Chitinophagaceae bacterium]|nr:hypothetical protein [Chitinophagaceae bacterium]
MRNLYALLFTVALFATVKVTGQITVANPTNTTPNLAASYTTLASALTDLNAVTAMSGPVKFTISAGYSETAPATGLTIGSASLNAVLSSTNTVTITKASGTVTLNSGVGTATPTSAVPDGILKLVGADYITIDGLSFVGTNTTNPASMEYAIGLFKRTAGDGCNFNTIQNCEIILPNVNNATATAPMIEGSVGILVINSTPTAATTSLIPTNAGTLATNGTNSNNKFYNNKITGCNYGIGLSGFAATAGVGPNPVATTFLGDLNNDIGGNSLNTGNLILNFGGIAGATNAAAGIRANQQWGLNVSYNTVNNNDGANSNHVSTIRGIYTQAGTSANVTINNNNVTIKSGGTTSQLSGIENAIGSTAASNTVSINNNNVVAEYLSATTGTFYPIWNSASAATVNMNNNKVANTLYSNSSVTGTGVNYLIYNNGAATNVNIIGDTVLNHTRVGSTGGTTIGILVSSGTNQTVKKNFVSNLSIDGIGATSTMYGIQVSATTIVCDSNTVRNIRCIKTTGTSVLYGIYNIGGPNNENYNFNTIDSINHFGTGTTYGLYTNTTAGVRVVSNNLIRNISTNGLTVAGTYSLNSTPRIFKNKIYNISSTSVAAPTVSGILLGSFGTSGSATIYNNLISDLNAPNATSSTADLVRGINLNLTSSGNVNVYFNTIFLNATSSGADFSTSGVYHASSTTPTTATLDLRNNIIINTSTANGAGTTVALRRNGGATANSLANFSTSSNYNLYYVGIPVGNNYIYYDGTNAANTIGDFQIFSSIAGNMAPRGSASVSEDPEFQSLDPLHANFLKFKTTSAKPSESGGVNIAGITDDYVGTIRQGNSGYAGTGTAPDMGAWELNGIGSFSCNTPAPGATVASANNLCLGNSAILTMQNATAGTGVSYQWQSSPDGTSYSNISGAQGISFTVTPTKATYYRCAVTCQNGPTTINSTAVQLTFANSILSKTDSARCGTGSVVLKATGNSGTTIKWYTDSIGGASIGTGSPFNTPSISATTKYYASAEAITTGDVNLGTATTATTSDAVTPFGSNWEGARVQYLVLASELQALGLSTGPLNSLAFNVTSSGAGTFAQVNFTIKLAHTTNNNLTGSYATPSTPFETVYTAASEPAPSVGQKVFTFSTPFNWDGVSNIAIDVCHDNDINNTCASCWSSNSGVAYTATTFNSVYGRFADNVQSCGITASSNNSLNRPNLVFNGNVSCASPRVPVTATVSASSPLTITGNQTICNNTVATISVTSNIADYNTYIWTPVTNLFTDAACTTPYTSGTSVTTVYVKSANADTTIYTCTSNNTTTLCSNVATTKVTTLPSSVTISTPISDYCLSGSPVISTSPAIGYGSATFQWQISSNNTTFTDISGATNLNYSSPLITSTTYFKLNVSVGTTICITSNVQTITINNPTVLTTTDSSRCGSGTVILKATGSSGTTLSWYASSTGGAALGTGTSFTTPLITTTTPFYVAAENYTPGSATVGTATTTTNAMGITPYGIFYEGARTQYLFTADELRALGMGAGPITGLTFNVTASGGGTFNQEGFTIKMAHTTNSALTAAYGTPTAPFTIVYGPIAEPVPSVGLKSYTYTTPFVWDGASNILVDICHDNDINNTCTACYNSTSSTVAYSATSFNSVYGSWADNIQSCGVVATSTVNSTNRPNITFNGQLVCASARTTVTATVTSAPAVTMTAGSTVCNNSITALSVTSTIVDYDNYQWTPAANLYTDAAATVPYTGGSSATTVYFKSATAGNVTYTVTGNQTGGAQCSNFATATMTVLPSTITLSATPAELCFTGSSTISSNPNTGLGNAIFQWKSSPDSTNFTTISGASSTSYTTPTLTTTTFYKYEVKAGGNTCLEPIIRVKVNAPAVTSTTPAARCGTGTVTLGATSSNNATLKWYTASTGGASVGSGLTYTTPSISATTTYYVSANEGGGTAYTGAPNTSVAGFSGPSGQNTTTGAGIIFDILNPNGVTITSIDVYPTGPIGSTISVGVFVGTSTTPVASFTTTSTVQGTTSAPVVQTLPVNFVLPAGTGYQMRQHSSPTPNALLIRYALSTWQTYTIPGEISLTGSVLSGYYYYFYNWLVSTGCESPRTSVVATVHANPSAVAVTPDTATQCTNSPAQVLKASGGEGAGSFVWSPTTGLYTDAAATVAYTGGVRDSVYAQPAVTTTYTATSTNSNNCTSMDTATIIV